jgi:hypothetical protein
VFDALSLLMVPYAEKCVLLIVVAFDFLSLLLMGQDHFSAFRHSLLRVFSANKQTLFRFLLLCRITFLQFLIRETVLQGCSPQRTMKSPSTLKEPLPLK